MIATSVHAALVAAGIPIVGVSIGKRDDKTTWTVDFAVDATDEQKTIAEAVLTRFDQTAVVEPAIVNFADAMARLTDDEYVAVETACAESVQLRRLWDGAKTRGEINLVASVTRSAFSVVIQQKLFTRERLAEILGVKQLP